MPNETIASLISSNLKTGLPHPGYKEQNVPAQVIHFPGMNFRGMPQEMLDHYAREAGLPSSDLPKLVGEAIVNLIETQGDSEIVNKAELGNLRDAAGEVEKLRAVIEGMKRKSVPEQLKGGDEIGSSSDADGPVDGEASGAGGQGE